MGRNRIVAIPVIVATAAIPYYMWKQSLPLEYTRGDVVAVWLEPVPEGVTSPRFAIGPGKGELPLGRITDTIPSPLPRDVWQGFSCDLGGNVVVELHNGETIRYGPCRRPEAIEDLRKEALAAIAP